RYDFSQHAIRPSWTHVLEALQSEYAAIDALAAFDRRSQEQYGTSSLGGLATELEGVRKAVGDLLGSSPNLSRERLLSGTSGRVIAALVSLRDVLADLERLAGEIFVDAADWTFEGLRAERARLLESIKLLPDWLPCLAEAATIPNELANTIRTLPLDLLQVE